MRDAAGFALGVQWHPEYWVRTDPPSQKLFAAFGDAVRPLPDAGNPPGLRAETEKGAAASARRRPYAPPAGRLSGQATSGLRPGWLLSQPLFSTQPSSPQTWPACLTIRKSSTPA